MSEELDRREMLEAALEQAEDGTLEAPIEKEIEVNDDPIQAENAREEEPEESRDEKGRFKSKAQETDSQDDSVEEPELVAEATDEAQEEVKAQRPTTWKKANPLKRKILPSLLNMPTNAKLNISVVYLPIKLKLTMQDN